MLTRRDFIKLTGASTVGWYVATQFGWALSEDRPWFQSYPAGVPHSLERRVAPVLRDGWARPPWRSEPAAD
jgi:hypothetical protein